MLSGRQVGLGAPIRDRAAWAGIPGAADIVSYADQSAADPAPEMSDELYLIFKKTGSRREFEEVASRRRMRLTWFVLAECIEATGRFLAPAEKEIAAILGERTWTLPAHDRELKSFNGQPIVDLAASQRGWILALADYLLGERLLPETRSRIRSEVARRVLLPYREAVLGNAPQAAPWIRAKTNWNPVCHAGVVGAALALGGDPAELAWFLSAAENFLPYYFDGFGNDGYCPEGLGYWNYGFGHLVMLAQTVGRATGWQIDFFLMDKVEKILAYPDRIALFPGVFPAFSDMDPSVQPEAWIAALAKFPSDQDAGMSPCGITKKMPLNEALAAAMARCGGAASHPLALRDEFPDAGVFVLRGKEASSGKGLAMAFKIGDNGEPHNHDDIGSYVVARDGSIVLADPGAEIYTARTFGPGRYESRVLNSYGHPVPAPDGALQDTGARSRGAIADSQLSPDADSFLIDLGQAYAKAAPGLNGITRSMEFRRAPQEEIRMTDKADFREHGFLETALITFGTCSEKRPGELEVACDKSALQVSITSSSGPVTCTRDVIKEKLPGGKFPLRIGLKAEAGPGESWISYSLRPPAHPAP